MPRAPLRRTDSVRSTYVLALGLVALLTILAQLGVHRALDVAEEDGGRINRSGRQRMLSQRVAKSALVLGRAERPGLREELEGALRELRESHDALSSRPGNSAQLRGEYEALRPRLDELVEAARDLARRSDSPSSAGDVEGAVTRLLRAEAGFLPRMDAVVDRHQAESDARLAYLRRLQRALLAATLLVLALEACFVFEPLRRALQRRIGELQRARESAEEAVRVKDEFLAMIGHELRTPLGGVLGSTELLQDEDLEPEQRGLVEAAQRSGRRLARLIDAVLDHTQPARAEAHAGAAPFDLPALVAGVLDEHADAAREAGVELSLEAREDLPARFVGDATRVERLLGELVENGVKFTERGSLCVHVEAAEPASGNTVVIEVEDTGIGIPADRMDDLFESFRQLDGSTSRRFEGAGVGLTLCRAAVEALGGALSVRSKEGCGSTFRVELPLAPDPAAALPAEREPGGAAPLAGLRVLAAEDDRVNRRVLEAHLARLGCEVTLVEDGAAAVERAAAERFDVVLLDCRMPVLDGYGAAARIRGLPDHARTPLLALTAETGDDDRRAAAGMNDCLTKPYRREELRALLERWAPSARGARVGA